MTIIETCSVISTAAFAFVTLLVSARNMPRLRPRRNLRRIERLEEEISELQEQLSKKEVPPELFISIAIDQVRYFKKIIDEQNYKNNNEANTDTDITIAFIEVNKESTSVAVKFPNALSVFYLGIAMPAGMIVD